MVQDSPGTSGSVTTTFVSVTLPVFCTRKVYGTTVPALPNAVSVDVFASVIAGLRTGPGMVSVAVRAPRTPKSGVPTALAAFVTDPKSTSACVIV